MDSSADIRSAFSEEEYADRLAAVRARMADADLVALVLTDPANLYYLTGYNAWSFYTPQCLVVPADGDLVLYARAMDARGAQRTCRLPPEQIAGYPESLVHRPHEHPFTWIAEDALARGVLGRAGDRVGVELDAHFFSPKGYLALTHGCPDRRYVDSLELVNWVRVVKSDAEIALMRQAARVTTAAMQAAVDAVRIGAGQHQVAAQIAHAQALGVDDAWGDFPAIVPMLPTSESADTPHLTWSDRRLVADDAVVVELAGAHRRYHVPLARTVLLGSPSRELGRLEDAVSEGLAEVLSTARASVPVAALTKVWDATLARYGLSKESRLGYSIGIGYPPDWGERTISIRDDDPTVLAENMTLHVICGMWMDGFGYEMSESIRIAEDGVETFTSLPRRLLRPRELLRK